MPAKKTVKKATIKKTPAKKIKKAPAKKISAKKAPVKTKPIKKSSAKTISTKKVTSKKAKKVDRYEESQFLASIKPYALKKNEKYMNAKQKKAFSRNTSELEKTITTRTRQNCRQNTKKCKSLSR